MRRPRRFAILVGSIGAVCQVLLIAFLIPIPHTFALRDVGVYDGGPFTPGPCFDGFFIPEGAYVEGHWTAPEPVRFYIVECTDGGALWWTTASVQYTSSGASGSFSFFSDGRPYEFGAAAPVVTDVLRANVSAVYFIPSLSVSTFSGPTALVRS